HVAVGKNIRIFHGDAVVAERKELRRCDLPAERKCRLETLECLKEGVPYPVTAADRGAEVCAHIFYLLRAHMFEVEACVFVNALEAEFFREGFTYSTVNARRVAFVVACTERGLDIVRCDVRLLADDMTEVVALLTGHVRLQSVHNFSSPFHPEHLL